MTILFGILIFGLLVFVHELGHFLLARLFRMKVHAFAIGMGPALWKKEKNGIEYSIRLLPVGGYVKLEGEDETSRDPGAFQNKSPLARILVLFAGGFMNIVAGFLIFLILFANVEGIGIPVVDSVIPDSPAAVCGLKPDDIIAEVNGKNIHIQNDLTLALMKNKDRPVSVTVLRGGEKLDFNLTPAWNAQRGGFVLGFYQKSAEMTPLLAVKTAFYNTFFVVDLVYYSVGEMITGKVRLSDMAGPVGIVNEMSAAAKTEMPLLSMLNFMGLIAVNLGVMNLLPIPALDGGRILFILFELIRRKPLKPEHEGLVHFIGFILLILFMLLVTFSDIQKLFA